MIHLDANALVALPNWARDNHSVLTRVSKGEAVEVSTLAWYEFLCGPIQAQEIRLAEQWVRGRIVPLDIKHARLASELFNLTGRRRGLRTDTLIAAAAISSGAELLTLNTQDFLPFVPHGLKLMSTRSSR